MSEGIVYVITNPAMPGFVKVGITMQDDLRKRINNLSGTNVPYAFQVRYAARVSDARFIEQSILGGLDHARVKGREFLEMPWERIVQLLKMVEHEDVTPDSDDTILDSRDKVSRNVFCCWKHCFVEYFVFYK